MFCLNINCHLVYTKIWLKRGGRTSQKNPQIHFSHSPCKHKHAQSCRREYGVLLQGLSTTVFLPRWFDYGTYLPTAERREQIPHRWAPLPVCVCACALICVCPYCMCVSPQNGSACVHAWVFIRLRTVRACVHFPFSVLHRSVFVSLYLFHLSWHANPSVWRCEMWVVASDCVEIWAVVIFRFGIPLSL